MSFQTGLSGLNASSQSLDVIGNNIANANTVGMKSSRAEFADLVASVLNRMPAPFASGAFVGQNVGLAAQAVVNLQRLSGQSTEEIVKQFAGMRDGVAQWAATANKSYAYLTIEQYKHIRALEAQGRTQEAIRVNLEAFNSSVKERAVPALGSLERAMNAVKAAGSGFWDWVLSIGRTDTVEQQLASVTKQLEDFEAGLANVRVSPDRQDLIDAERRRLSALKVSLQQQVVAEQTAAKQKADLAAKTNQQIQQESTAYQSAVLGVESALQAQRLAIQVAGNSVYRRNLEQAYEQFEISGQTYTDKVIELERQRSDAELESARQAVAIAAKRSAGTPQEVLARTQAEIAAQNQLIAAAGRRAQIESDIAAGKYFAKPREVPETPASTFRQSELAGDAYRQTQDFLAQRTQASRQAALDLVQTNR